MPERRSKPDEARRPFHITLHDDDVVFVQHAPMAENPVLIALLESHFTQSAVFVSDDTPIATLPLSDSRQYQLIRGNLPFGVYDNGVYARVARSPLLIPILRDPLARAAALYEHHKQTGKIPADMSLEAYARHRQWSKLLDGAQARLLAGTLKRQTVASGVDMDQFIVNLAWENLKHSAVFGLADNPRESVQLACYVFGWALPPAADIQAYSSLSNNQIEILHEAVGIDAPFYGAAQGLFAERYKDMYRELNGSDAGTWDVEGVDALLSERRVPRANVRHARLSQHNEPLNRRLIRMVRNAAPPGTRRRQVYLWMRDTLQRHAPKLANAIAPKKKIRRRPTKL